MIDSNEVQQLQALGMRWILYIEKVPYYYLIERVECSLDLIMHEGRGLAYLGRRGRPETSVFGQNPGPVRDWLEIGSLGVTHPLTLFRTLFLTLPYLLPNLMHTA